MNKNVMASWQDVVAMQHERIASTTSPIAWLCPQGGRRSVHFSGLAIHAP